MFRSDSWKTWTMAMALVGLVCLAQEMAAVLIGGPASGLHAQEPAAPAEANPVSQPQVPAESTAAADAAPAQEQPKSESYLRYYGRALGPVFGIAFLALSFTFVAFLVMNILNLRQDAVCPAHLAEAFEAQLNEKRFQEAFDLAKSDESMLGQMLAAGMQHLQQGYPKAVEAMGVVGEDETLKLEHRLSFLSLVGAIAPMLGLLGTVWGMVQSFQVIARSQTQPKPSELAHGISMALVTTLVGLMLAIPAIIAFNLLKNRLTRLVMETGQQAGNLMARFETMGKK